MWKWDGIEVEGRGVYLKGKMERTEGVPRGNANNANTLARFQRVIAFAYMSSSFGRVIAHLLSVAVSYHYSVS